MSSPNLTPRQSQPPVSSCFQIKCECTIFRQNFEVPLCKKSRSKFSTIILDPASQTLKVVPFGTNGTTNANSKSTQSNNLLLQTPQEAQNKPNVVQTIAAFNISKLRTIHKKYLQEGKATFEFYQHSQSRAVVGMDVMASETKEDVVSQLLINNASKENLELLINKLIAFKKQSIASEANKDKVKKEKPTEKVSYTQVNKKVQEQIVPQNRKKQNHQAAQTLAQRRQNQSPPQVNRKKMIQMAMRAEKGLPLKINRNKVQVHPKKIKSIDLLDLPDDILNTIFFYTKTTLQMRLVSKGFSKFILRNINSLRLKDNIDCQSFNKLAKYAVNVECRMKNVKKLELSDRYQSQTLVKDQAKTLKFGDWKEMSAKNIDQLKGLRIYCLQIPYVMKFDFSCLFGIRLMELRLKGVNLNNRNLNVKEQDVIRFVRVSKQLKVLQLAHASSNLLIELSNEAAKQTPQVLQKLQQLTIDTLNVLGENYCWTNFRVYPNLKIFGVSNTLKDGVMASNSLNFNIKLPENLISCTLGSFVTLEALTDIPKGIERLKLIGDRFFNQTLQNLPLGKLKLIDISECRYIGGDGLSNFYNVTVITKWDRETVVNCNERFVMKQLNFLTIK